MSFLRPKIKMTNQPVTPNNVASPSDTLNSLARMRRLSGGRNAFAPAATASTRPPTVTGVQA